MSSALYVCRNAIYRNCRRFTSSAFQKNNSRSFIKLKEFQLNSISPGQTSSIRRCLSTQPNADSDDKPRYNPLMEFPQFIWPGFFQMIKCQLTCKLALPPAAKDFDLIEFIEGSQQALYVVSNALSREDYESLDGLVTPEAIEVLKKNISRMSEEEKKEIELQKKEFVFCFPWDISVRNGTEESSKIVEIIMVFHLLRNWNHPEATSKVTESDAGMPRPDVLYGMVSSAEYLSHAIVCNYRFIREFGDFDTSWSINVVNQFKLSSIQG